MSQEEKSAQPEQIMAQVRERVREESLADDGGSLEELRLLHRDINLLRESLEESSAETVKLSQEIPPLNYEAFADLDQADNFQEIPAPEEIARYAPLNFLYKAWRKGTLKTQRLFNKATAKLFRHTFQNQLRLERGQLEILQQMNQLVTRLDALEKKTYSDSENKKSDT